MVLWLIFWSIYSILWIASLIDGLNKIFDVFILYLYGSHEYVLFLKSPFNSFGGPAKMPRESTCHSLVISLPKPKTSCSTPSGWIPSGNRTIIHSLFLENFFPFQWFCVLFLFLDCTWLTWVMNHWWQQLLEIWFNGLFLISVVEWERENPVCCSLYLLICLFFSLNYCRILCTEEKYNFNIWTIKVLFLSLQLTCS